jgi:hypothetical protein
MGTRQARTIAFRSFVICSTLVMALWLGWKSRKSATQLDLAGIEKLYQADIVATLDSSPNELASLWGESGVLLERDSRAQWANWRCDKHTPMRNKCPELQTSESKPSDLQRNSQRVGIF